MAMAETREISAETEVSEIEGSESESELSELTDDPPPTSSNTSNDSITILLVTVSPRYLLV